MDLFKSYCPSLLNYNRRETIEVKIGDVYCGSMHPIRVQSMTTVDTMNTKGSIEQVKRMVDAGCEYVRITAPSKKEAQNLEEIKKGLIRDGYNVPLIADIHFTPNAAEVAARIIEKVRINPGNYADKKRFDIIEYDDQSYQEEIDRIRARFVPLVHLCKEYGTAMRIGTNHGSLSDRILSRYGDTPHGMVESALEFLRICEDESYYNIVLSMKASNTRVMVQAYRLLAQRLDEEGLKAYPLHLGVTEAGEGEDGRIKSAVGIGTLLEDGLGDTVRVSLTEEPELEAPVAKALVDRYTVRKECIADTHVKLIKDPYNYQKRETTQNDILGGENVPRVVADFSTEQAITTQSLKKIGYHYLSATDKWAMDDLGVDFIYLGDKPLPFMPPSGLRQVVDFECWTTLQETNNIIPFLNWKDYLDASIDGLKFVSANTTDITEELMEKIQSDKQLILVLETSKEHAMADLRAAFFQLIEKNGPVPVIIKQHYDLPDSERTQLYAATDLGGLLVDGLGDGIWLTNSNIDTGELSKLSFGILQAARTRMTKTEYISCPSCGRTLFDLQETTAKIRARTDHLKGVKIGIMGCIVNGPGEMADADYGYVGSGPGKISLYKGQEVIKKGVPSEEAVDQLIELIKEDGSWIDPVATT